MKLSYQTDHNLVKQFYFPILGLLHVLGFEYRQFSRDSIGRREGNIASIRILEVKLLIFCSCLPVKKVQK